MRINETRQPSESLCVCAAELLGGGADRFQGNPFARGVSLALLDTYPSYFVSPVRSKRGVDESVELTRGKRDVLAGHSPAVLLWRGHSRKRAFRFCVCVRVCVPLSQLVLGATILETMCTSGSIWAVFVVI